MDVDGVAVEGKSRILRGNKSARGKHHESDYGNGYGSAFSQTAGDGGSEAFGGFGAIVGSFCHKRVSV